MLDNKSSGDRLPSKDGFRPLPLEVGQNGKRDVHKQPTLAELREALQVLGAGGQKESGALRDDMFLVFAKADPKPIDFDKSLKDMDADSLDALAQPNGSRFSPEQFTRIRKITADELKAIKGDADKVSKLSPLLIKTLSATAVLGFLDDKDKPNRFIDLMDKKQAEALLFRLDQDPAFRLFLKDQAPKVKADVAKLVEGLKENLGLGVKADPPGKPPGDPLEPRPPKKPADVPAPPPKLTEKEKEQLPKLVEELKDALAKDKFAQWCGPKGEKLGELALLLNRPGADAKDVKECQKIIESITPAQIKTLDPAQLAGLTGPVIAQMNMHALIGLTNEQIAVLTKHQHTAIMARVMTVGPNEKPVVSPFASANPDFDRFRAAMNERGKVLYPGPSWLESVWTFVSNNGLWVGGGALMATVLGYMMWHSLKGRALRNELLKSQIESEKEKRESAKEDRDAKKEDRDAKKEKREADLAKKEGEDASNRLRDDKMSRDKTRSDFRGEVDSVLRGVDPKKPAEAGKAVSDLLTRFAMNQGLDPRLADETLKIKVEFSSKLVEPSEGMRKGKMSTSPDGATMTIEFPTNASADDIAHDSHMFLYELERSGEGSGKAPLRSGDRTYISRLYARLGIDFTVPPEAPGRTASDALPDKGPASSPEPVKLTFGPDGVTIGSTKCPIDLVAKAIRDELREKLDKIKDSKGTEDPEYKQALKDFNEHDAIVKGLESSDPTTRDTATKQAIDKIKGACDADEGRLAKKFSEDLHRAGGDERGRSRAVVIAMFAARYAAPAAAVLAGFGFLGTQSSRGSETKRAPIVPIVIPKKPDK